MDTQRAPTATVTIRRTHWATLEPVVPDLSAILCHPALEFALGGPLGHVTRAVESDGFAPVLRDRRFIGSEDRIDARELQVVPQGLVGAVENELRRLGYAVEVRDSREDSPRWVRRAGWKQLVDKKHRGAVEAAGQHRTLRVAGYDDERVADTIEDVATVYPEARIAVAVPTYTLLDRIRRRLGARLAEPLGLFTAKRKRQGRIAVGLVGQLPGGETGERDLLVIPYGDVTLGDGSLRRIMSEQYRRILCFTRSRRTRDQNLNRRFLVVAGSMFPEEKKTVPVTVAVLTAHGTRIVNLVDAFDEKKHLCWLNARRNRRIAEVARSLIKGTKKAVRSVVGSDNEQLVKEITSRAKRGVAILVETPVHARALADLLPEWVIWTAGELKAREPKPGCGVIVTERAARETVIGAEVLIRATGTRWPLPDIDWPWPGDSEHGVLIDFEDDFHPTAKRYATKRAESYVRAGMTVYLPARDKSPTEHIEATGASR